MPRGCFDDTKARLSLKSYATKDSLKVLDTLSASCYLAAGLLCYSMLTICADHWIFNLTSFIKSLQIIAFPNLSFLLQVCHTLLSDLR